MDELTDTLTTKETPNLNHYKAVITTPHHNHPQDTLPNQERLLKKIESKWPDLSSKNAISRFRSCNFYQYLILANGIIVMFAVAFSTAGIGYLLTDPKGEKLVNGSWVDCEEEEACKILASDPTLARLAWPYPDSWSKIYGYTCDKAHLRDLSKTLILMVATMFCVTVLAVSDIFGRKVAFFTTNIVLTSGMALNAFFPNLKVKTVGLGVSVGSQAAFFSLFTFFINESTHANSNFRGITTASICTSNSIGIFFVNFITLFIRGSFVYSLFGLSIIAVCVSPSFFTLVETLKWTYSNGYFTRYFHSLTRMAKFNSLPYSLRSFYLLVFSEESGYKALIGERIKIDICSEEGGDSEEQSRRWIVSEILQTPKYLSKVAILICQGGAYYMVFFGLEFSIQDLGLETLNYNGMFFGATQIIGTLSLIPFVHKMPRKTWILIFQLITIVCGVTLAYLSHFGDSEVVRYMRIGISTCVLSVVNGMYSVLFLAIISDSFPPRVRGTACSLIIFVCKILGSVAPLAGLFAKEHGYHIVCGCSAFTLVSFPVGFLMTETLVAQEVGEGGDEKGESVLPSVHEETQDNIFDRLSEVSE